MTGLSTEPDGPPPRPEWRKTLRCILLVWGVITTSMAIYVVYADAVLILSLGDVLPKDLGSTSTRIDLITFIGVPIIMAVGVLGIGRYEYLVQSANPPKPASVAFEILQFSFGLIWFSGFLALSIFNHQKVVNACVSLVNSTIRCGA